MPDLNDFVYISDSAYSKDEILEMEYKILKKLQFDVAITTSWRFLERFLQIAGFNTTVGFLAQYLIELTLIEQRMLVYPPSLIAAAAVFLAIRLLYRENGVWTTFLQE